MTTFLKARTRRHSIGTSAPDSYGTYTLVIWKRRERKSPSRIECTFDTPDFGTLVRRAYAATRLLTYDPYMDAHVLEDRLQRQGAG